MWIECGKPSHGEPRRGFGVDSFDGALTAIVGPFDDERAAKEFAKQDSVIWIYGLRRLLRDPSPEELGRATTPEEWSARARRVLAAVWIRPKKRKFGDDVGPFEDEATALQFAGQDALFSGRVEFELRRNIKPNDLLDADTPEAWTKSYDSEIEGS